MNPYEVLQVRPGASPSEIQQAYRDLVRVWHPDRFAHDARLQKVADEKLRHINQAFAALANGSVPPPKEDPPAPAETPPFQAAHKAAAREKYSHSRPPAANGFNPLPWVFLGLAAVGTFGLARLYFMFTAPLGALDRIHADALRIASFNGPKLSDAFKGWNGSLPQGLSELMPFYNRTPQVAASFDPPPAKSFHARPPRPGAAHLPKGIGEIQVHNRTNERAVGTIAPQNNSALRRFSVPPQGEAVLDGLGPAVYYVDVSFPDGRRPAMRIGPFEMMESQTAKEKQGDRYEITLTPAR